MNADRAVDIELPINQIISVLNEESRSKRQCRGPSEKLESHVPTAGAQTKDSGMRTHQSRPSQ